MKLFKAYIRNKKEEHYVYLGDDLTYLLENVVETLEKIPNALINIDVIDKDKVLTNVKMSKVYLPTIKAILELNNVMNY